MVSIVIGILVVAMVIMLFNITNVIYFLHCNPPASKASRKFANFN
jgi:hypothetical protein